MIIYFSSTWFNALKILESAKMKEKLPRFSQVQQALFGPYKYQLIDQVRNCAARELRKADSCAPGLPLIVSAMHVENL